VSVCIEKSNAGFFRHIGERAIVVVVVEAILAEIRDIDIRPAIVIVIGHGAEGSDKGINHAAFENPNGTRALIITNAGPARTAAIRIGDMEADVALDNDSITSLVWS
jgi:hypothetical protein